MRSGPSWLGLVALAAPLFAQTTDPFINTPVAASQCGIVRITFGGSAPPFMLHLYAAAQLDGAPRAWLGTTNDTYLDFWLRERGGTELVAIVTDSRGRRAATPTWTVIQSDVADCFFDATTTSAPASTATASTRSSAPTSTAALGSETPLPNTTSHSSSNSGPMIGAIVGGVSGALLLAVAIFLVIRRRNQLRDRAERELEPGVREDPPDPTFGNPTGPQTSEQGIVETYILPVPAVKPFQDAGSPNPFAEPFPVRQEEPPAYSASRDEVSDLTTTRTSRQSKPLPKPLSPSAAAAAASTSRTSSPQQAQRPLSQSEADTIRGLVASGLRGQELSTIVQAMMSTSEAGPSSGEKYHNLPGELPGLASPNRDINSA